MTGGYKCHGTTDLFAARKVTTGEVLYGTRRSHKINAESAGCFVA
jgi:hypothetical protein